MSGYVASIVSIPAAALITILSSALVAKVRSPR